MPAPPRAPPAGVAPVARGRDRRRRGGRARAALPAGVALACAGGVSRPPDAGEPEPACTRGGLRCDPDDRAAGQRCGEDGRWETMQECGEGLLCTATADREGKQAIACAPRCGDTVATRSYQGCEYFAVDLPNVDMLVGANPREQQFAVVVAYTGSREEGTGVRVYRREDGREELVTREVALPGRTRVIELPQRDRGGPAVAPLAYRIESDDAITAYQFNPLNNVVETFSNDASLLLPAPALDAEYLAVTGDGAFGEDEDGNRYVWGAFVAVVGLSDGTAVRIEPTARLLEGSETEATLDRYDVLTVLSDPADRDGNLSGTRVSADRPVAVFAGNLSANVPVAGAPGQCCADHLEEQMIPLSAWGTDAVAARSMPRRLSGRPEPDVWVLTGGADGVEVSYQPERPSAAPERLGAGESVRFPASGDFVVRATGPIQLAHLLPSSEVVSADLGDACLRDQDCLDSPWRAACGLFPWGDLLCLPAGDPALTLVPPIGQFRTDSVFLAPDDYFWDFAIVTAPAGAEVLLDGEPLAGLETVGEADGRDYAVARVEIGDGSHRITSELPVGVMVQGLDAYVSYGYVGGMNLEQINIE